MDLLYSATQPCVLLLALAEIEMVGALGGRHCHTLQTELSYFIFLSASACSANCANYFGHAK